MITDIRKAEILLLSTDNMIELAMTTQEKAGEMYDELKYMKFILKQRMETSNATVLAHPDIECKAKKDNTSWDYSKLHLVHEDLDPDDIKAFYTPEHEETIVIPEKYDMRVGKGFLKYGGEVKEKIESATIEGKISDVTLKRKG